MMKTLWHRPPYKIPNSAVESNQFNTVGGWEVWRMMMDMWHRIGRLEMAVFIGGSVGLAMLGAILGRTFNMW